MHCEYKKKTGLDVNPMDVIEINSPEDNIMLRIFR